MANVPAPAPFDPSSYPAYFEAQRKEQIAQLLQQSLQNSVNSPDPQAARVGPYAVQARRGALQNIAPLVNALMYNRAQKSANLADAQYMAGPAQTSQDSSPPPPASIALPADQSSPMPQGNVAGTGVPIPAQPRRNPMVLGPDVRTAAQLYRADPKGYMDSVRKQFDPTDIERQLNAAGITDPALRKQYMQQNLAKSNYIAPVDVRPGGTAIDPMTHQPIFSAPQNGVQNVYGPDGSVSAVPVPGAAAATQAMDQASAAGKTLGSPVMVPQKGGGSMPVMGSTYFGSGAMPGTPGGLQAPTVARPGPPASIAKPPDNYFAGLPKYSQPAGTSPQSTTDEQRAKDVVQAESENFKKFGEGAQLSDERQRNNMLALQQLGTATTGPWAEEQNHLRGVLQQFGLAGPETEKALTSSTELGKYLNNNALAKAKQTFGGGRLTNTDVTLAIEKLNPGTNMTDKAIYNLTVEDGIRAAYSKQMAADYSKAAAQGADPRQFEQWYANNHPLNEFANRVGPQIAAQASQQLKGGIQGALGAPSHSQADLESEMRKRGLMK